MEDVRMIIARTMVYTSNLPIWFWSKAVMTTVYVLNRIRTRTLEGMTFFEAWYKVKPSIAHLHVFGFDMYMHVPKELRKSGSPKTCRVVILDIRRGTDVPNEPDERTDMSISPL
jgi:L-asparagine transporter-like permease